MKRKCDEAVSKVSRVTSTTTNSEDDEFPYLEPPAEENGDEHNTADLFVHDLASAVKQAHNYSSVNCSVGKSLSRVTYQSSEHGRLFCEFLYLIYPPQRYLWLFLVF